MSTTTSKTVKFSDLLKRSDSKMQKDRADQYGSSINNAFHIKKGQLKQKLFELKDDLAMMTNMTASNSSTSLNHIKNFNATKYVEDRHKIKTEIYFLEQEIKLFEEDEEFYN